MGNYTVLLLARIAESPRLLQRIGIFQQVLKPNLDKKQGGNPYPAKTVYHLFSSLLRFVKKITYTHFRALRQQGIKSTMPISLLLRKMTFCGSVELPAILLRFY